jgi:hypothetical protein
VQLLAQLTHVVAHHLAQQLHGGFNRQWAELESLEQSLALQATQRAEQLLIDVLRAHGRHQQRGAQRLVVCQVIEQPQAAFVGPVQVFDHEQPWRGQRAKEPRGAFEQAACLLLRIQSCGSR